MTVVTAQHRDRLDEAKRRTRAARERIAAARKAIDAAQRANESQARAAAEVAMQEALGEQAIAQELENTILHQIAGITNGTHSSFLEDPATLRELESLASSRTPIGNLNLGPAMSREDLLAQYEQRRMMAAGTGFEYTGDAARRAPYMGVVAQLRRRLTLLDLIPTAPLDNRTLPYVQEGGSFDTAAETAEEALKPQGELTLTDAEAEAKTIAHWVKVPRQTLADVAGLGTVIQSRLIYGVNARLESQIVAGDGTGENLLGLLHTTGLGDVAYAAGELAADQSLEGIVDVLLSNANPNAVVLNPRDWADMLKAKATGSGEYLNEVGPFVETAQNLWGTPAILSPVIPVGTALVGDFTLGTTVFVREAPNLRVSDSDQDDFTRNRTTLLGEGRFALAIWQPAAFAVVHFTA